jgi:hypothetical protein
MLRLKNTVNKNMKHPIFLSKQRGRKIIFDPNTVDPSEYEYYKSIGFNLFEEDGTIAETPAETIINDEVVEVFDAEELFKTEITTDEVFTFEYAVDVEDVVEDIDVEELKVDIIPQPIVEDVIDKPKKKGRPKKQS